MDLILKLANLGQGCDFHPTNKTLHAVSLLFIPALISYTATEMIVVDLIRDQIRWDFG